MLKNSSNSVREDREKSYTEFYSRFIKNHFRTDHEFMDSLKDILNSGDVSRGAFECGGKLEIYQCAYLLQFGVRDACLGEEKFRESAAKCEKLASFCSKKKINICCLGSRAFLTVLGVCKVIYEYVEKVKFSSEDRRRVQIFIVDKTKAWKVLFEYIVKDAKREYPSLNLKLDFLTKDVTKDFSESAKKRIQLSHFVTMVKYISDMDSKQTAAEVTKNTLKNMKKNAVLFYLDNEASWDLNELENQIVETKSFSEIKSCKSPEKYILQDNTKAHHQTLYEFLSPLNTSWDTDAQPVLFSTWIKNPDVKIKYVEEKQKIPIEEVSACRKPEDSDKFYRPKRSSNMKRNSKQTFKLVGRFSYKDIEKKNKDDSKRSEAKEAAVSRYANFDDW